MNNNIFVVVVKINKMELFDDIINSDQIAFQEGRLEGAREGQLRMERESFEEGRKYGIQIGNELQYYATIVAVLKEWKYEHILSKTRIAERINKLENLIANISIANCYEPNFGEDMKNLKLQFQKIMSMLHVGVKQDPSHAQPVKFDKTKKMFHLLKGLYSEISRKEEKRVLVVGPTGSGKTVEQPSLYKTLINQIMKQNGQRFKPRDSIYPTKGQNGMVFLYLVANLVHQKTHFKFKDLAGDRNFWRMWKSCFSDADTIVVVLDGTATSGPAFEEQIEALGHIFSEDLDKSTPVIFMINKNDLEEFSSVQYSTYIRSKIDDGYDILVYEISAYSFFDMELFWIDEGIEEVDAENKDDEIENQVVNIS